MSEETIFAKIIRGEARADKVYEDEKLLAIKDIQPLAPVHILIIPKKFIRDISQATDEDQDLLGAMLLVATDIARQQGLEEGGYRLAFNCGEDAGLMVPHLHLHLIGGSKLGTPA